MLQLLQTDAQNIVYRVEYDQSCSSRITDSLPLADVPVYSTALDIMKIAASMDSSLYQFSVTFTEGDGSVGYYVDRIGNTRNEAPCYWNFYIDTDSGGMVAPDIGVDAYIPGNNFRVILRYEGQQARSSFNTTYVIDLDSACTMTTTYGVTVTTSNGSTALDVMEQAVRANGRMYVFSADYIALTSTLSGTVYGYSIKQVNGIAQEGTCSWAVFVTTPSGVESALSLPLSEYIIPQNGYTLTLRFSEAQVVPTTTGSQGGSQVAIFIGCTGPCS